MLSTGVYLVMLLMPLCTQAQADPSSLLDLQSTDRGFLLPRMSSMQRDSVVSPATGLMLFNSTSNCLEINLGTPISPMWYSISCRGTIGALQCGSAALSGPILADVPADGLQVSVPYLQGTAGAYPGQQVDSQGVTGLTVSLQPGHFNLGDGVLTYTVSGTPSGAGTATFSLTTGAQSCTLSLPVTVQE